MKTVRACEKGFGWFLTARAVDERGKVRQWATSDLYGVASSQALLGKVLIEINGGTV